MSVATELFDPSYLPEPGAPALGEAPPRRHLRAVPDVVAVPARPVRDMAGSVAVLHAPQPEAPPLRLTRRGVVVLALLVAALGAALVWVAALSAPSAHADSAGSAGSVGASTVTVRAGDTLWSIADRTAPGADPRAEVDRLRTLNHLDSVALVPGQQLRVH